MEAMRKPSTAYLAHYRKWRSHQDRETQVSPPKAITLENQEGGRKMSLPSPNSSFNRSSHLAVVVAVVLFSLTHFLDDLGVDLGPDVICDRVLILHIIVAQHASL